MATMGDFSRGMPSIQETFFWNDEEMLKHLLFLMVEINFSYKLHKFFSLICVARPKFYRSKFKSYSPLSSLVIYLMLCF